MKLPILILCFSVLSYSGLVNLSSKCPEQFVPNLDNICIRPSYIEACETYKNSNECAFCSKGNQRYIQITISSMESALCPLAASQVQTL